jgi:nucleoside-diphosphate-sugar epimerase
MTSRILVFGADHYLGARVFSALRSSSWAVPVAFRAPPPTLSAAVLQEAGGIVNCTGGSAPAIVACARALYPMLCRASAAIPVVHLSSMTIYGSSDRAVDETSAPGEDLSAYAAAQVEGERYASLYPQSVRLRLGCEYGPGCAQWSERVARWLIAHRVGDLGSAGDGSCNLLYVDDLVAAVSAALQLPSIGGEVFNLAMRSPPSWNEYFERFGRALGAIPIRRIGPRRLMVETKIFAPPLKVLEIVARGVTPLGPYVPPPIPPSVLKLCGQHIRLDVLRAESALHMKWTSLDEGLATTAAAILSSNNRRSPDRGRPEPL